MSYCPDCHTHRECDARGCSRAPVDLFGESQVRYKVEGKGAFPIDMLRLDCAWPATSHSAARIVNSYGQDGQQEVELRGVRTPNFRAWLAASWKIKEINGVLL